MPGVKNNRRRATASQNGAENEAPSLGTPANIPDQSASPPLSVEVNQELYKRNAELAIRNKTLALLRKLDEISMATLGVDDMAHEITTIIAQELGYDLVSVALVEEEEEKKRVVWISFASPIAEMTAALKPIVPREIHIPFEKDVPVVRVIREGKESIISDAKEVYTETVIQAIRAPFGGQPVLKSSLVYPLRVGSDAIGIITFSARRNLNDLSRYEQESIGGIIGLVALALYKAKIYQDLQQTTGKLQVANTQLEQLDKAKSEFLSIASHQLYTPLTAIKGYLSMVQEKDFGELPEKIAPVIGILRESSDRLIDLIRNLLDVSRIESGRLELAMESIDLVKMASDLVTELTPNAQRKGLALGFQGPSGNVPHVVGDAQRLRQVLLNTVDNAIKYTPKGTVDVRVVQDDDSLIFSVRDTGKGIAKEEISQLFNKFTRVGGADRFHTEGTGLGLYVARQIVREHHGDIWAESPGKDQGSTFLVRLPIEGSSDAHKAGTKVTVGIKAAEPGKGA